ncbi:hypothetical protein [Dongshaea marina]|uniref:hypothetical protein n=1 Tax=Dongshaea marina TaxID=2047966 RepID=UPI000D3E4449|nr:hypothetical protein [Dongshaea marina]
MLLRKNLQLWFIPLLVSLLLSVVATAQAKKPDQPKPDKAAKALCQKLFVQCQMQCVANKDTCLSKSPKKQCATTLNQCQKSCKSKKAQCKAGDLSAFDEPVTTVMVYRRNIY